MESGGRAAGEILEANNGAGLQRFLCALAIAA